MIKTLMQDYIEYCHIGDLTKIIEMLSVVNKEDMPWYLLKGVEIASLYDRENIVFYLLPNMKDDLLLHSFRENLNLICSNSVKCLQKFISMLPENSLLENLFEIGMKNACSAGNIDVIKFLLEQPIALHYIERRKYYNQIINYSFEDQTKSALYYFLNTPELNKYIKHLKLLEKAYEYGQEDLVKFLIDSNNIDYTKKVKKAIKESPDLVLLFEEREIIRFKNHLEKELDENVSIFKRIKL